MPIYDKLDTHGSLLKYQINALAAKKKEHYIFFSFGCYSGSNVEMIKKKTFVLQNNIF